MKLSEAILKGCEISPNQAIGSWWTEDRQTACVLGSALLAHNPLSRKPFEGDLIMVWPVLEDKASEWNLPDLPHVETPPGGHTLFSWMVGANENLEWSRETIAQVLKEHGL